MDNEFPPNSNHVQDERASRRLEKPSEEKPRVTRVVKGKVTIRKKPLYKKFLDAFRPEDNKGFAEYVLLDMLVPGLKDAVADASTAAIDNALGVGGGNRRSRRGGGSRGYTAYSSMGGNNRALPRREREQEDRSRNSGRREREPFDAREVILDSRVEAEDILDQLYELVSKYDAATMRDLLGMLGEAHTFTDEDWGWTDLRGSRIHRIGQRGYLLDLPRAVALD